MTPAIVTMLLPGLLLASWRWLALIDLPFVMALLATAGACRSAARFCGTGAST